MIVVIIAGGSGTRLWPLSTPEFPKHLLKVAGDQYSILQNTYQRARKITDNVYVVSEISHIDHVKDQLKNLDDDHFIIEPARKGTANCILAALVKIGKHSSNDETIGFIHADHYVRDTRGFVNSFSLAANASLINKRIVLIGVEPTYPATGFGYVQKDGLLDKKSIVYCVDSFKEKPDFNKAQEYQKSGDYLWNCGYFVASIDIFISKMKKYSPLLLDNYNKLLAADDTDFDNVYLGLDNEAIDYALIEKVKDLLVVPASFDWLDLGSFSDLSSIVDINEEGNFIKGQVEINEVGNCYIENQEAKPIAVIGLDNCVVINTKDGILVARKDMSQKVGDIAKRITAKR